jgi:hydrogenase nickel incorporation protein HypA/HybF
MHELSIALNLLDLAAEAAAREGGVRVSAVHVKVGPLSGVVTEALLSAYELAREESSLADSQLVIEESPIVIGCEQCEAERTLESIQSLVCPDCGTPSANIIGGRELDLIAVEVEE